MSGSETFAERLRRLREHAGLTQEELAERAGLSSKAVSLLERGERTRPYPHTVSAIADALGLTEDARGQLAASVRRRPGAVPVAATTAAAPLTTLLGRDGELRELATLLRDPATRIVTLTGPGGVGKTSLALAVAEAVAEDYPAGRAVVALAPVASPDLVLPTLVRALGLKEDGRDPREALARHLDGRRVLLLLDNLEHLLPVADDLAALSRLPGGPVLLVTSRRPLRLRAEVEHPVPPLWIPATPGPSAEAVLASPAGRLFAERARGVARAFAVTEENAGEVAAICRELAGLPLALEIAAARTRYLGTSQLLARLGRLLHDEGARDLDDRQRTLARTLDWSHDLLAPEEQTVFARLSAFRGSFRLDAAEAVAGDGVDDLVTTLGNLVEHSLLTVELPPGSGEARYRMLEPVRQYAEVRLRDAGEEGPTLVRHTRWYLALAEEAYPHLERDEQVTWLEVLRAENDNLRVAIGRSVASDRPELAVRLGWALRMYWLHHGRRGEGRRLLEPMRDRATPMGEVERARLLHVLAFCHYGFGGPHAELAREAVGVFRHCGDEEGEMFSLGQLGYALLSQGRADEAAEALHASLVLALHRDDDTEAAHVLNHLSAAALRRADLATAGELAERALSHTRRTGERLARQTSFQVLAQLAWVHGDTDRARQLFVDSLELALELSDDVNVAYCLRGLAVCDGRSGTGEQAARLLGAADALLAAAGHPRFGWLMDEVEEVVEEASTQSAASPELRADYEAGGVAGVAVAEEFRPVRPGRPTPGPGRPPRRSSDPDPRRSVAPPRR